MYPAVPLVALAPPFENPSITAHISLFDRLDNTASPSVAVSGERAPTPPAVNETLDRSTSYLDQKITSSLFKGC